MIPLYDTIPSRRTPFVTWMLIAANVFVFALETRLPPESLSWVFQRFGVVPARYRDLSLGRAILDAYPFLTSLFLHGGWFHLFGNMWTLWIFGDNVEDRMGHARFLVFYLLVGLVAGLFHTFLNPSSTVPTVGASGAISGVLGAYFVLFPTSRIITFVPLLFLPVFFELPAVTYLFIWALTQVFGGVAGSFQKQAGGIAWWAHVGGFLAGMLAHRPFLLPARKHGRRLQRDEWGIEGAWNRRL